MIAYDLAMTSQTTQKKPAYIAPFADRDSTRLGDISSQSGKWQKPSQGSRLPGNDSVSLLGVSIVVRLSDASLRPFMWCYVIVTVTATVTLRDAACK